MAKNYIFENEELKFNVGGESLITCDPIEVTDLPTDLTGATLEIGGEKFLYAGVMGSEQIVKMFTRDGQLPESAPEEYASMSLSNGQSMCVFNGDINKYPVSGAPYTLSVYLYTEEDDGSSSTGLPDMNVTYEFSETAKNDIEDIIKAIYEKLGITEEPINGHSPMDRLVFAVANLHDVNPNKALSTGNYPNQFKRIAAIIRGDFGSEDEGGGEPNFS